MKPARFSRFLAWTAQFVAAAILAQTLFFKFTAAPESVEIFSRLGVEPWGRVVTGLLELLAVALLLWPRAAALGALLALGLMSGAILAHLTRLGIAVQGDGGLLFALALVTWGCAAMVVWLRRAELPWPPRLRRAGIV